MGENQSIQGDKNMQVAGNIQQNITINIKVFVPMKPARQVSKTIAKIAIGAILSATSVQAETITGGDALACSNWTTTNSAAP